MAYESKNYKPNKKSREILDRAWEHIQTVPYKVTLRWLFYRVYQDGLYPDKKKGYQRFVQLLSRARHNGYAEWEPGTLADDTNETIDRGSGFDDPSSWARAMAERGRCNLHRWDGQTSYVEVWFEARAMIRQFEFLTQGLKLCPLGGQPSIPYKWELAQGLDTADRLYDLPIVVLYFGDLDAGGQQIGKTVREDVWKWCDVEFEFVRAALNPGDEIRYGLPDNPEKPGQYQWEAVDHETATRIITGAVSQYVDADAMATVERLEERTTKRFREHMAGFVA